LQRWLNQDPIGEAGGINLYRFVRNNSVNKVDPLGLEVGDWYDVRTWIAPSFWSRQQVDDFARSHGYKDYRDAINYLDQQLPNYDPTEFDSILSERAEAVQITGEALGDATSLYIQAATSITPTCAGAGVIYKATKTPSGKPYIGRTTNPKGPPGRGKRDLRDRADAEILDTYGGIREGKKKEQIAIDENGGLGNLDNKRNEIAPDKRGDYGLE
jgi:hypothetical protein